MDRLFEVFVIGGGINGCGCAADAALRGLSVALCEKGDLASQTSSKSTKLIHGGLRYLEQYDFNLVRKALIERQNLLELAPHLVHPLKLVLPYEKHMRPAWLIRTGLLIYDNLSRKNKLPRSHSISRKKDTRYFEPLKQPFNKGFIFYDGTTNDSRLTLCNALQAKNHGAAIFTHTELIQAEPVNDLWQLTLKNTIDGSLSTVKAKSIINATGPWVEEMSKRLGTSLSHQMVLVKGSHIVVPKLYEGDHAYFLQGSDKRVIFAIPYYGYTMIGTTDEAFNGPLKDVHISETEISYLCDLINQYFNQKISKEMIINSWSGLRPLIKEKENNLQEISRDYSYCYHQSPAPVVTIYGGKITTYRKMAAEVIDQLKGIFPSMSDSKSSNHPLPGAVLNGIDYHHYKLIAQERYAWLDKDILMHYLNNYGTRTDMILNHCQSMDNLGLHFGHELYQKEVDYLINEEWALTAEDILWRRTKLGLKLNKNQMKALEQYLRRVIN